MPDPSPTDPIAVLQSLLAAFNRGTSGGTTPPETSPHLATAATDLAERLARIEDRLARLEARAVPDDARSATQGTKKRKRTKRD